MYWQIPKLFPNSTIAILGGRPTLLEYVRKPITAMPVIGVNEAGLLGSWVDVCWFVDSRWYFWNQEELKDYKGILATYNRHPEELGDCSTIDNINVVKPSTKQFGICTKAKRVKWNRSSGAAAINLAYHLGAVKILLLGFDMRIVKGRKNWHPTRPQEPSPTEAGVYQRGYGKMIEPFYKIAEDAKRIGLEIINCTPGSALDMFPFGELV